jgi:uncharacterized protein YcbK (DUF882 family)
LAGRFAGRILATLALAGLALIVNTRGLQDAVANGDTRTITIYHTHTKETATVTFRRNGSYDPQGLEKLNWLLRDWRRDEATKMDPRLFDVVWEVHRESGSDEPLHVVSAYRSPATNSMLRRRSSGVAKHSQHMVGKAMDFYLPDTNMAKIREIGMRLQRGGVGFYPSAYNPFVHLDAGSVRSWPRMTRDQLARLFPDGKTVHLPADGQPMAGYEEAKADILSRGGAVAGYTYADADEGAIMSSGNRRSLWAALFGGDDEEEARPQRGRAQASRSSQTVAYAPASGNSDDAGTRSFFSQPTPPAEIAAAPRRPVRGPQVAAIEPRPTPEPEAEPAPAPRAAAPAPVTPPAPLLASGPQPTLAPAPAPRPVGLALAAVETPSGSRMQWQTGPGGRAIEVEAPASRVALVEAPMPPRRPDDLARDAAGRSAGEDAPAPTAVNVAMVAAPVPPARPSELAPAPALRGAVAALDAAAVAPARPVDHPAPPERPLAPASVASLTRQPAPAPAIPVASAAPAPTPQPATSSREVQRPRTDRDELQALFAAVANTPVPTAQAPVATARTRQAATPAAVLPQAAPNVVARFGAAPAELRPDRFTGPAVRPLTGSFSRL